MSKNEYHVQHYYYLPDIKLPGKLVPKDSISAQECLYYKLYDNLASAMSDVQGKLKGNGEPSRFDFRSQQENAKLEGEISGLKSALNILQKEEIKRRSNKKFTDKNYEMRTVVGLFKVYLSDEDVNSYYYVIEGKTEEEAVVNFYKEYKDKNYRQIAGVTPLECMMPKTSIRGDKEK